MTTIEAGWKKRRPVGVGTFRATPRMKALVGQVLDSGRISYGPMSQAFESRFAARHSCRYGILSNSGTSALQVALQAMRELYGWADGDEVIVPATTFVATANIVLHNRMQPVFVDVDPLTYNLNPVYVERAITPRTRAVLPVHLFGQPADMTRIAQVAGAAGLKVIEDSCETMFVEHCGRPVGSWGDTGCFSTYVAHLLVTGVGGVATTNDPDLAGKMRSLVNHGLALEFLNPGENFAPRPMPGRRFRFESPGHSFRITELEAALGLAQLETVPEMLSTRRRNARHLTAGVERLNRQYGDPLQAPVVAPGNGHAWMMYPLVLRELEPGRRASKEPLLAYLNENGIETRDMLPILGQPAYAHLDPGAYPVSRWIAESGFYVGCHQDLTPEDIQYVVDVLERWFDKGQRTNGHRSAAETHPLPAAAAA